MNINNVEEIYRIVKYSFNKFDVVTSTEAYNLALRFFNKYYENFNIKQVYAELDMLNQKYHIYIAY